MNSWRDIASRSPEIKIKAGKSKSKFNPKREINVHQQQNSFVRFKDQKSFSHNRSKIQSDIGAMTGRSDVDKAQKINKKRIGDSLDVPLEKIMSPSRSAVDPFNENKQSKNDLTTRKNEMQLMKLKRQFLEFQRNIRNELKKQQKYLNDMMNQIFAEIKKIQANQNNLSQANGKVIDIPNLHFQNSPLRIYQDLNSSEINLQSQQKNNNPQQSPKKQIKSIPLKSKFSHKTQNYENRSFPVKGTQSQSSFSSKFSSRPIDASKLLSAINQLKTGMREISQLSEIEYNDSKLIK